MNLPFYKTLLVTFISIGLLDGQTVIKYKMFASKNPNFPSSSNTLTKYHAVRLDRAKAGDEQCVDNEECQKGTCLSSGVCQSGIYFQYVGRFAGKFYFKLICITNLLIYKFKKLREDFN